MPCDNLPAIQCLHYELFRLLQPNSMNIITTCNYPLHPEKCLRCALMPRGSSLSSKNQRTKIMQKSITDTINDDEDSSYSFVERILNMIEKKNNYVFFNTRLSMDIMLIQPN